jgi:hypothetical protein
MCDVNNVGGNIVDLEARIKNLESENVDLRCKLSDESFRVSVLEPTLLHMYTRCLERGERASFIDAVQFAINDTGAPVEDIVYALQDLGFGVEVSDFRREFKVSVTVPVHLSLVVEAVDEEEAGEVAPEMIADEGLDNYYLDWDTCDVEIDYVEEA